MTGAARGARGEVAGSAAGKYDGNERAAVSLESLYRRFAPAVIGYLRGQGAADPEDLAGDVFVAITRGLARFRGDDDDLRAWVFTIAHHRLVDDRRRHARRAEQVLSPESLVNHGGTLTYEDATVARLTAAPAVRALDDLTPDQRAVVLLRVVADLSVSDVASILAKTQGAVKTLQRRAIATLARNLSLRAVS